MLSCELPFPQNPKYPWAIEATNRNLFHYKRSLTNENIQGVQQVKDPAWSLKCPGSNHWPRNFHMLQMWTPPQKNDTTQHQRWKSLPNHLVQLLPETLRRMTSLIFYAITFETIIV